MKSENKSIITDEKLLKHVEKICKKYAEKLYSLCYDYDDLMQECLIIYTYSNQEIETYKKEIKNMLDELLKINNKETK